MSKLLSAEVKDDLQRIYKKWSKPVIQISLGLLLGFLVAFFWQLELGQRLDFYFLERYHVLRGVIPPPTDVVIVTIDDAAYEKLGESTNFPLPRHYFADAFERIVDSSAKVVMLDGRIPFERGIDPAADARIEEALKKGPTTIWSGEIPPDPSNPATVVNMPSEERFRKAAKIELSMAIFGQGNVRAYLTNSIKPDASLYERVPVAKALVELGKYHIEKPGPLDLINFYGPPGTIQHISIYDFIVGDFKKAQEQLKDKVVIIGYQSVHFAKAVPETNKDQYYVTGATEAMYGSEIHGNMIGNLQSGIWLRRFSSKTERLILIIAIFLITCFAMNSPSLWSLGIIGFSGVAALLASYFLFLKANFWLSGIGAFLIGILLIFVISAFYFFKRTTLYKKYINKTYGFEMERDL